MSLLVSFKQCNFDCLFILYKTAVTATPVKCQQSFKHKSWKWGYRNIQCSAASGQHMIFMWPSCFLNAWGKYTIHSSWKAIVTLTYITNKHQ